MPIESVATNRVVLADDNADFLAKVRELLGDEWDVVATVGNGLSAIRACRDFSPDLLILDISMGQPNGLEVAKLLNGRGASPKILFLTTHDEPEIVLAALSTGAAGYVLKSRMISDIPLAMFSLKAGRRFISPGIENYR